MTKTQGVKNGTQLLKHKGAMLSILQIITITITITIPITITIAITIIITIIITITIVLINIVIIRVAGTVVQLVE